MTAIVFPADVLGTAIPIEGFGHKRQPAGVRTDMESGFARFRVTNRNPFRRVTVGWRYTDFVAQYFNAWLEYRATYGGSWFEIDLPIDGPVRTVLARFVGEAEQKPYRRVKWLITAELEVRDTNAIGENVFGVVEAYGLTGMADMLASIEDLTLQPFYDAADDYFAV